MLWRKPPETTIVFQSPTRIVGLFDTSKAAQWEIREKVSIPYEDCQPFRLKRCSFGMGRVVMVSIPYEDCRPFRLDNRRGGAYSLSPRFNPLRGLSAFSTSGGSSPSLPTSNSSFNPLRGLLAFSTQACRQTGCDYGVGVSIPYEDCQPFRHGSGWNGTWQMIYQFQSPTRIIGLFDKASASESGCWKRSVSIPYEDCRPFRPGGSSASFLLPSCKVSIPYEDYRPFRRVKPYTAFNEVLVSVSIPYEDYRPFRRGEGNFVRWD